VMDPQRAIAHWSEFDEGGHFPAMEVPDLLVGDVREFFRGLRWCKRFVAPSLEVGPGPKTTSEQAFPNLTEREHQILSLVAEGYINNAIDSRLYLSPKTVRNYVSSIFTKLEVEDRSRAIVRAREAGLGTQNGFSIIGSGLTWGQRS
jgi:DNA-binding NarL/FixJ family response regulator